MTNLKTPLVFVGKILVGVLAISVLLLIVGRDLFQVIQPLELLLYSGFGVLLLIAVVSVYAAAMTSTLR